MRRLLAAVVMTAALAGCGGSSGDDAALDSGAGSPAVAGPNSSGLPASVSCSSQPPVAAAASGSTDLTKKPQVEIPDGPPPCDLVVADIVKGTGAEAKPGDTISVKYVGVTYADGNEFDASWGGQDLPFQLGAGQVIPGWDNGVAGMRVGGRRQLTIPPELGYGPTGNGPIPPNATLVFVVDLVKVG